MDNLDIDAIRARCDAATPGEWKVVEKGNTVPSLQIVNEVTWEQPEQIKVCSSISPKRENDANFIAHARADIPALLDEVERLQKDKNRISSESIMQKETIIKQSTEIATLTKALKMACEYIPTTCIKNSDVKSCVDYYIQKAKEDFQR